jgi:hypothetical protein
VNRPSPHYTRAKRIRKHPVTGVYSTAAARKLRRRNAYRVALAGVREYGKDVLWGTIFFIGIWVAIIIVVVAGLLLVG